MRKSIALHNCPIRGCPDDVPGICKCKLPASPKLFVSRIIFSEYFKEKRVHYRSGGDRRKRTIFQDNASGHYSTEELTAAYANFKCLSRKFS